MEQETVIQALSALAQPHRLQIYRRLVVAGLDGERPGQLATSLELAPATLSFHLKELLNAGLVSRERLGRQLIYRADFGRINAVLAYLTENCCQGDPCQSSIAPACDCAPPMAPARRE